MNGPATQDLLRDAQSGAYRLAFLVEFATKELDRARRYGRSFSLATLSLDDTDGRPDPAREVASGVPSAIVAAVSRVIRDADVLARGSDGGYHVLLPETDSLGALTFIRRAAQELRGEGALRAASIGCGFAAGWASFPDDGADLEQLVRVSRRRRDAYRASIVHHLDVGETAGFWEAAGALLHPSDTLRRGHAHATSASSLSAWLAMDAGTVDAVTREVVREIGRDVRRRGALYIAASSPAWVATAVAALPTLGGVARSGDVWGRVVLLGPRVTVSAAPPEHPLVDAVPVEGEQRIVDHPFLLLLSERTAYALLCGPGERAFHTSDVALVDALVARLQRTYELPPF